MCHKHLLPTVVCFLSVPFSNSALPLKGPRCWAAPIVTAQVRVMQEVPHEPDLRNTKAVNNHKFPVETGIKCLKVRGGRWSRDSEGSKALVARGFDANQLEAHSKKDIINWEQLDLEVKKKLLKELSTQKGTECPTLFSYLLTGRAKSQSRMSWHDKPSTSGVIRVQTNSINKLWHIVLGATPANGFSIDNNITDKQILVWILALQHLQYIFHINIDIGITLEDESVLGKKKENASGVASGKTLIRSWILDWHWLDVGAAAVNPFQKMCFLQCQVEESVIKVPKQDIPKGLTLIRQEAIPQGQSGPILRNSKQEYSANGQTILEKSLFSPGPTYHLQEMTNRQENNRMTE